MARNTPKAPVRSEDPQAGANTISDESNPHDPDATSEGSHIEDDEGGDVLAKVRPTLRGGAAGIVPEATRTIHPSPEQILENAKAHAAQSPFAVDKKGVEPRRFRIINERRVLYNGSLMTVRPGKEYAEHECDLPALARQGVQFEQISGPAPEE